MGKLTINTMIVYSTGAKTIGISDYKNNLTICQNGIPIPPSEVRTCIKSDYSIPNPIISYRIFIIESPGGETNKNKTLYKAAIMRSSYGCEVPIGDMPKQTKSKVSWRKKAVSETKIS